MFVTCAIVFWLRKHEENKTLAIFLVVLTITIPLLLSVVMFGYSHCKSNDWRIIQDSICRKPPHAPFLRSFFKGNLPKADYLNIVCVVLVFLSIAAVGFPISLFVDPWIVGT